MRVATFGDSTATYGSHGGASNACDQEFLVATASATVTIITGNSNKLLAQTQYPGLQVVADGGISGNTTAMMLSRDGAAAGGARKGTVDVLGKRPDIVFYRGASINDILALALTEPATDAQISAIAARHLNIFQKLRAGGPLVIDECCAGFDAQGGVAPANKPMILDAVVRLNNYLVAWHAAQQTQACLSPIGVTCNADGSFITGATGSGDGVHLSYAGQYMLARAEAAFIKSALGDAPGRVWAGQNLLDKLSYLNVGGALPAGMTWGSGYSSIAAQAIEIDPKRGIACAAADVVNVTSGGYVTLNLPINIYSGAPSPAIVVTAGMKLGFELDWSVETKDGSLIGPGFYGLSRVNIQNVSGGRSQIDFGSSSVAGDQGNLGVSRIDMHSAHAVLFSDVVTADLISACVWRVMVYLPAGVQYRVRVSAPSIVQIP